MNPISLPGTEVIAGVDQGYAPLPMRITEGIDEATGRRTRILTTGWQPTPDDIIRIVNGAPIIIAIYAANHPPITVSTTDKGAN